MKPEAQMLSWGNFCNWSALNGDLRWTLRIPVRPQIIESPSAKNWVSTGALKGVDDPSEGRGKFWNNEFDSVASAFRL